MLKNFKAILYTIMFGFYYDYKIQKSLNATDAEMSILYQEMLETSKITDISIIELQRSILQLITSWNHVK